MAAMVLSTGPTVEPEVASTMLLQLKQFLRLLPNHQSKVKYGDRVRLWRNRNSKDLP